MIAGISKTYNLPFEYVLYELSYANLSLYGAVIPSYNPKDKRGKGEQETIMVDDPGNREKVARIFDSFD